MTKTTMSAQGVGTPADGSPAPLHFSDALSEVVARFDTDLRHTFVNKVIESITGLPREQFLGKTNQELGMPTDLVAQWDQHIREVFRTGQPEEMEFSFVGPTATRHFKATLTPEKNENGLVSSVVSVARDITEVVTIRSQLLAQKDYRQALDRQYSAEYSRLLNVSNFMSLGVQPGGRAVNGADILESHFRSIVENSEDAIISKTLDGIVTSWNRSAQRIFGYTEAEMLGKPMLTLFPKERRDEEVFILEKLVNGETVEHFETVRVSKDGHRIDVSVTISPIRDAQGNVVGASKIARDISLLKKEQQRLQVTLEATSDGLWDWDLRTGRVFRTPQYYDAIGAKPEDDTQDFEFFKRSIAAEDLPGAMMNIQAHLRGEAPKVEFEFRVASGGVLTGKWLQVRGKVIDRDSYGNPARMLGTLSDITRRKQLEEVAVRRGVKLQRLLEGADHAFWEFDLNTHAIEVSARWQEMLGYAPGELETTREHLMSLVHPDDVPAVEAAMADYLAGRTDEYVAEMRFRDKAGQWTRIRTRGRIVEWLSDGRPSILAGTRSLIAQDDVHPPQAAAGATAASDGSGKAR